MSKRLFKGALLLACITVWAVGPVGAATPVPALTVTGDGIPGGGVTYSGANDWGFSFTPTVDIEVTDLGFWVPVFPPHAIVSEHEIAIFPDVGNVAPGSAPSALARVLTGTGGTNTSNPNYRYAAVDPPVTLSAGAAYVIVGSTRSEEIPSVPLTLTDLTVDTRITVNGPRRALREDYGGSYAGLPTFYGNIDDSGFWGNAAPYAAVNFLFQEAVRIVSIDIKPGGLPNNINPASRGNVPVAILSDPAAVPPFYATTDVDFDLPLTFGKVGDEVSLLRCNTAGEDVNLDLVLDVVCHFKTSDTGFQATDTQGVLRGTLSDGGKFTGTDSVRIVP